MMGCPARRRCRRRSTVAKPDFDDTLRRVSVVIAKHVAHGERARKSKFTGYLASPTVAHSGAPPPPGVAGACVHAHVCVCVCVRVGGHVPCCCRWRNFCTVVVVVVVVVGG
jgi:hypothetical protein